jgi:hypothetical protein
LTIIPFSSTSGTIRHAAARETVFSGWYFHAAADAARRR